MSTHHGWCIGCLKNTDQNEVRILARKYWAWKCSECGFILFEPRGKLRQRDAEARRKYCLWNEIQEQKMDREIAKNRAILEEMLNGPNL